MNKVPTEQSKTTQTTTARFYHSTWRMLLLIFCIGISHTAFCQQSVSGKVTAGDTTALTGVSVQVKGTPIATQTNSDGHFSLSVPSNSTLVFSFIGFATQEIPVGNQQEISVQLQATSQNLNDVVVVGYGTQKRKDLTGSVASLSAAAYKDQPVLNTSSALQGRVAGVAITNTSGAPGADVKIRIRGANSVNAGNAPLYVVDGVALGSIGLGDINVNDIENIQVLKDASATAIYGSRGANGVIIITTKSGKAGTAKIDYNGFVSLNEVTQKYDLMDAATFAELANHIAGGSVYSDPASYAGKGTNWQDLILQQGTTQNHQIAVSGGTEKSKYYLSLYYVDQHGILINTSQKKFALRSNIDTKITDRLSVSLELFATRANSHNTTDIGGKGNPVMSALSYAPTGTVYDSSGGYNRFGPGAIWGNPCMVLRERDGDIFSNSALANARVTYKFTDWLSLNVNAGLDMNISKYAYLNNDYISPGNPGSGQSLSESYTLQNSNNLTFHNTFGKHDLTAMAIVEETSNKYSNFGASGSGLTSTSNGYYNLALNTSQGISSGYSNWALMSYVGRISYAYNDKYLITATYRADGSSKFQSTNNKWGYFPSIGAGWRLSEENFIKNLNVFSNLKLRGSWGITGNQNINPYSSLGLLTGVQYSFGSNTLYQGYTLGSPNNPDLKWETTTQSDIGVDAGFWDNRINITVDVYKKRTKDLLLQVPIAAYDGGGSVFKNIGVVDNKGFEFMVDVVPVRAKNFTWTTTFNLSAFSNKVVSLGKDSVLYRPYIGAGLINTNIQVVKVGQPLGAFYLIPWTGVYQQDDKILGYKAGDNRYVDVDGNGSIGYEDRVIAGSAIPKFTWGWNNNFHYNDFELNVFVQASQGNKIFNASYAAIAAPTSDVKYPTLANAANYWSAKNTSTIWADPGSATNRNFVESTHYLQDGSYVRLKNVSLSYTFPQRWVGKTSLRLSASAQNVFTITRYKGYDPEATSTSAGSDADAGIDLGAYPSPKTYTFALHIGL